MHAQWARNETAMKIETGLVRAMRHYHPDFKPAEDAALRWSNENSKSSLDDFHALTIDLYLTRAKGRVFLYNEAEAQLEEELNVACNDLDAALQERDANPERHARAALALYNARTKYSWCSNKLHKAKVQYRDALAAKRAFTKFMEIMEVQDGKVGRRKEAQGEDQRPGGR